MNLITHAARKMLLTAAVAVASLAAVLTTGMGSAQAVNSHNSGTEGDTTRCYTSQFDFCLIYDASIPATSAYWATDSTKVNDLSGQTFSNGTGSGDAVINNAGGIACFYTQCRSYVDTNQSGNYDYAAAGTWGELFYSWNNEASTGATQ